MLTKHLTGFMTWVVIPQLVVVIVTLNATSGVQFLHPCVIVTGLILECATYGFALYCLTGRVKPIFERIGFK